MRKNNATFCGGQPTWSNACVGDNGSPSYVEYAMGFSKAANLIIDQVLKSRDIDLSVDEMVYPVCFNMRHSIELRLKGAIEALEAIGEMKSVEVEFNYSGSHDLGNIWAFFKDTSEKIDMRYKNMNDQIEPTILDVAEVDATGQTFRYAFDTDSQRHLTEVRIINFVVLKEKFNALEKGLDRLLRLTEYLTEEYSLNTFTKRLSRYQLFSLANDLPPRAEWMNESFRETKQTLRDKYSLGSRDLSCAINVIQSNYELAYRIDSPLPLKGLDENDLLWFLDFWMELHPKILNRRTGLDLSETKPDISSIIESIHRDNELKQNFWERMDGYLTTEKLAGLNALFYFGYDKQFSETYVTTYTRELIDAHAAFDNRDVDIWESFMHIADKTNYFDNLVMSLFALHYDELAEFLVEAYGVINAFTWLDRARSREMFCLPEVAGY
ncbi:hypothetical protein VIBNISFn27_p10074 [Vibrio nigripulchritudo SFn27]|nr:hypothetical protein [Vibrio nigripulchritudo]CCN85927.1 hypothetical protein VIBNIBLFn1_p0067 [Vibrio nigripulchritudo BLFn1]CCN91921.1 hypothetical protein VIBNISFn27_p10074 [Vibrio nigripulchritudo SFn27]CCN97724.1 hypothetical protein VIBNIENn2_p0067 [Vibrio nigripulchritudo ENn2]CCO43956.1 hypothetical protein VIBNISFn135_p10074 [Vibrio nigripulchritudo SFn135]CCO56035.1 hypothetical protein VIBNIWn13_p0067 [Vibrio nigripulchritudo Wn13]